MENPTRVTYEIWKIYDDGTVERWNQFPTLERAKEVKELFSEDHMCRERGYTVRAKTGLGINKSYEIYRVERTHVRD